MKIGIDARLWYESGVGRYIRNLVKGIDEKNIKSHEFFIFLNDKAYKEVEFRSKNFKKVKADVLWHSFSEQIKFKKIIDSQNLDLVHFTYFSYPFLYKKPFVITIHDLIIDHFPTGKATTQPLPIYKFKRLMYKKIINSASKNAKKIIVPSNATKEEIIEHYKTKSNRIEVIYEGFDKFIRRPTSQNTPLVSQNFILYVGNAYPHKNLENLIKAFKKLRESEDVDLVCIGRNDFFYERLEDELIDGVYYLHNIEDSELFDYHSKALCVVVPSLMEGFGLPLLEAMNLSCPVVSSNTKALREIGGNACLYFDPQDIDDIENTIKKVIISPKLSKDLKKKGKERSKKFSWNKTVEKTLKLYENSYSLRQGK